MAEPIGILDGRLGRPGSTCPLNPIEVLDSGVELFRVAPNGDIESNGEVVTGDAELARLFRAWIKVSCRVRGTIK